MTQRDKLILAARMVTGDSEPGKRELTEAIVNNDVLNRYWVAVYGNVSPSGLGRRTWLKLRNDIRRASKRGVPLRRTVNGGMKNKPSRKRVKMTNEQKRMRMKELLS